MTVVELNQLEQDLLDKHWTECDCDLTASDGRCKSLSVRASAVIQRLRAEVDEKECLRVHWENAAAGWASKTADAHARVASLETALVHFSEELRLLSVQLANSTMTPQRVQDLLQKVSL